MQLALGPADGTARLKKPGGGRGRGGHCGSPEVGVFSHVDLSFSRERGSPVKAVIKIPPWRFLQEEGQLLLRHPSTPNAGFVSEPHRNVISYTPPLNSSLFFGLLRLRFAP